MSSRSGADPRWASGPAMSEAGSVKHVPEPGEYLEMPHAEKIEWMVEANGWALEAVGPDPDASPPRPACAYTIGLPASVDFPEVAVLGLSPSDAHGLIELVVDLRRSGTEIPVGEELVGLLGNEMRCAFAPVDRAEHGGYFATATAWYDGADFEVVQFLYPDRNGFLPYEMGFEQRLKFAQPVIGTMTPAD